MNVYIKDRTTVFHGCDSQHFRETWTDITRYTYELRPFQIYLKALIVYLSPFLIKMK